MQTKSVSSGLWLPVFCMLMGKLDTMSSRALETYDIVLHVMEDVAWAPAKFGYRPRDTLSVCALVNKQFRECALEMRWQELNGMGKLFKMLGVLAVERHVASITYVGARITSVYVHMTDMQ